MHFLIKILLVFYFFEKVLCVDECGQKSARILNGKIASTWPWIVSLQNVESDQNHFCGGSLISSEHILTAAQCLESLKVENIVVQVGSNSLNERNNTELFFNVSKIIIHTDYNNETYENDIALIKLDGKVNISNFICLPESDNEDIIINKEVFVAGWGAIDAQETEFPEKLTETKMKIYGNSSICTKATTLHYCAFDPNPKKSTICEGDMGGPLMFAINQTWNLFGISSYRMTNTTVKCLSDQAAYFLKVTKYIDWINEKMGIQQSGHNEANRNYFSYFLIFILIATTSSF